MVRCSKQLLKMKQSGHSGGLSDSYNQFIAKIGHPSDSLHVSASGRSSFDHHSGASGFKSSRGWSMNQIITPVTKKRNGARYFEGTVFGPNTQLYFAIRTAGP